MTQTVIDLAKEMKRLSVSPEDVKQTVELLEALPQVKVKSWEPNTRTGEEDHLIEMIFPKQIRDFLELLCDHHDFNLFSEIVEAYHEELRKVENNRILQYRFLM